MTLPPGTGQRPWPAEPAGAGHSAPSPSGGYVPPPAYGDEPATTRLPRVEYEPPPPGRAAGERADAAAADRYGGHSPADHLAGGDPAAERSGGYPAGTQFAGGGPAAAEQLAGRHQAADQPAGSHQAGDMFADDQIADEQPGYLGPAEERPPGRHSADRSSVLRLVWIYPDLLSTYGDRGNLIMLARRARLRGLDIEAVGVNSDQAVPRDGDVYLLGGGEDLPQVLAAQRLRADGGLAAAAARGSVVFAVCAGYQLIGSVFGGAQGEPVEGLSILDVSSGRGERRGVGEILADVDPALGLDRLTGFENHQGVTRPGPDARPLARTLVGVGNGDGTEGAYSGRILGTYLHGPALVRNPGLADLLLTWAVGSPLGPLPDSDETWVSRLRAERLAAVPA